MQSPGLSPLSWNHFRSSSSLSYQWQALPVPVLSLPWAGVTSICIITKDLQHDTIQ